MVSMEKALTFATRMPAALAVVVVRLIRDFLPLRLL
jgi:hypothetical protein